MECGALQEPAVRRPWCLQFIGTADLQTQQQIAGEMQTLLLDETPIIFAFFYNFLSAFGSNASGVVTTAVGQIFLDEASISA